MSSAEIPAVLHSQWFVPLFFVSLLGAAALLAVVSGWRTLARRFPPAARVDGERFYFASAKIGRVSWFLVNYGACLIVTIGRTGLSMSIFMPFRLFCPEFFVPWTEVESVEERPSALSRRTVVRIRGSSVQLALRGAVGQRALAMFSSAKGADAG